ncbi:MAG: LysM peptidoglycan-binding domain-containing protein [Algoriphagus sp.]|uniref:LysM peptidoglycan-binding domain-containing protein n=1 Tax=Algoriphagus sp. TaxID=1872435 RepID=UPI00262543DF|nr:LysM peptidoglycan-binding domain-containing protein [Algoriphagus sp.]MDG1276634.1 LysM peptidoglycan-binding domain-containing protein [Algoriphagus sp.]
MKKTLFSKILLVFITCSIPLTEAFSQDEQTVASTPLEEEVLPNYKYEYIPDFTYEEINERIKSMDVEMSFELNDRIFSFIQYFTVRNRDYTKMVMSRKELFFPLFDETMEKHEMPLEIKYLSIIESGLDPQIRSRVGAMGLWQFMPATGRMYGMQVNSDVDDRMDPIQSTEAAAKYLKSLYRMFGDWEVAMAAYNCGPGNVRKAIRRSGGKKTFWEIYNYLPRETRGYVPQFQAMLYVLNHLEEHNFQLEDPAYALDHEQIRFNKAFSLDKLAELTNLCVADLEKLNPSIKNKKVPESNRTMAIRVPRSKSSYIKENLTWIADSLNNEPLMLLASVENESNPTPSSFATYRVKSGDVLGSIASRHGVTVSQIKQWNNLSSNLIKVGQQLKVAPGESKAIAQVSTGPTGQTLYTVQPGDSLWIISKKNPGLTVEQLKRLNNLNSNNIKPGQKLIIG